MKKPNQVAAKGKQNVAKKLDNKNIAKKTAKPLKAKQQSGKTRAGKKVDAKLILPKKSANKNSEEDEDEEDDQDSGAELKEENKIQDNVDDEEIDEEDSEEEQDGDEQDEEEEDDEEQDDEEEDNEEQDDEAENTAEQDSDSDDEAPVEEQIKKEKSPKKISAAADMKTRSIVVKNLKKNTPKEKLEEVFGKCGKIESLRFTRKGADVRITYADANDSIKAINYHNSVFEGSNILVFHENLPIIRLEENLAVVLKNTQDLANVEDSSKLKEIFTKCGEITAFNVKCDNKMLASVAFKDEKGAKNALKLNGTEENGFKLDVTPFMKSQKKTRIFVHNIAKEVTQDDIIEFFKSCGNVIRATLRKNKDETSSTSVVIFESEQGYCQSFLLHEEKLKGQTIYIQPFNKKAKAMKPKRKPSFPGKFQKGKSNFQKRPNSFGKRESTSKGETPKAKKPKTSESSK